MLRILDSVSDGRFDLVQSSLRLMPEIGRLSATFSRLAAYETVRERPYYADRLCSVPGAGCGQQRAEFFRYVRRRVA